MKKYLTLLLLSFFLFSCQTRVATANRPIKDNTLALYQKYTFKTADGHVAKFKVLKVDAEKIYGKDNAGRKITINRSEVREVVKPNVLGPLLFIAAGVAAVALAPL